MTTHRAHCYCRRPNTLVNQSKRVSARIACMGSISLTAKNAKARGCASICVIKTDAQFANAQVWPSAPAQPSPLFSRETGVGVILFHAKYLLFSQNRIRRQRHTCVASVCAFLSWAVASCDIAAWGGADKSGTGGVKVCVAASLPRRRDTLKLTWATCFRMVKVLNGTMQ